MDINKDKQLFKEIPLFKNLKLDMVLFETSYNVLFTAIDNNKAYLIVCFEKDGNCCKYLITETSYDIVIKLLDNKTTIRDAFIKEPLNKIIITQDHNGIHYEIVDIKNVDDNILPTDGIYMESDDGEFDKEIKILKNRLKKK